MNNEKVTVSGALILNWYNLAALLVWCGCMTWLTGRIESLVWTLVIYLALVVVSAVVTLAAYALIFVDHVTLSPEGIVEKNRFRTKTTSWDQIIQAGFMTDQHPKVLVLVKSGGSKRRDRDSNLFFYLRNTGRIIGLPDEPGVAGMVSHCYGAVDFDLTTDDAE